MSRRSRVDVVQLWDGRHVLARHEDGLPTFRFGAAPRGLATRRQLRAAGLRPGGHGPVAQIKWKRGRRWAALYRVDLAAVVRPMTPARWTAHKAMMRARRFCRTHMAYVDHCVVGPLKQCRDCFAADTTEDYPEMRAA
ncbi:RRQRL motif-containing zinc-binding protein [Saccharothrix deserti]|uniref:RRQRL motif-containing zinc-binding protein n=1 Tax=Saccharothrix deserti TaxID=2593674 RepID=UPI00131B63B7|nr:RRQRL motif-containing zinc-binding protein [Saccharothrix deserti]